MNLMIRGCEEAALELAKLVHAALMVPLWEYILLATMITSVFFYYSLDFYFIKDMLSGFRGQYAKLIFSPESKVATEVLSKCNVLKERYWSTPWLPSPHLQTAFLTFFGRPPQVQYIRQLVRTLDGGTISLDWVSSSSTFTGDKDSIGTQSGSTVDMTPIALIVPGLSSDSGAAYVKHVVHDINKKGWRVVVCNHRGLGGVSITSDQFYNAGWTEDLRSVIHFVHHTFLNAPLFVVGTSIGANILVKYLGEEGDNTPVQGAVAICSPWDLLVCDRFIRRGVVQKLYDIILAAGLNIYARVNQNALARHADWTLVSKSRSVREFDDSCTRIVGKYETVDTYYRKCSSVHFLKSVSVPLLCVSALDDPICTRESIPWDECRLNPNIVLSVTDHGGHLAYFEGMTAKSVWWSRAATDYLFTLSSSSLMHRSKLIIVPRPTWRLIGSSIDEGSDLNRSLGFSQNGVITEDKIFIEPIEFSDDKENDATLKVMPHSEGAMASIGQLELTPIESTEAFELSDNDNDNNNDNDTENDEILAPDGSGKLANYSITFSVRKKSELLVLKMAFAQLLAQMESLKNESGSPKETRGPHASADIAEEYSHNSGDKDRSSKLGMKSGVKSIERVNSSIASSLLKSVKLITKQNRHTLLLLAYVALITTWPLLRSSLFTKGRKSLVNALKRRFYK